jgi:hypothetical protein
MTELSIELTDMFALQIKPLERQTFNSSENHFADVDNMVDGDDIYGTPRRAEDI